MSTQDEGASAAGSPAAPVTILGAMADDLAGAALALARSFAKGATMWCLAPEYSSHALHVAVEFVHPVIMGKRALPASPVEGSDPVGTLRILAAPGDLLVAIGAAGDPLIEAALRRGPAWGLRTVWIGTGDRPPPGAADHVLWLDEPIDSAAYGGGYVLVYHLLWELTHVCLEHAGLLEDLDPSNAAACTDEVCITCSDEGRVAEIVATGPGSSAQVLAAGRIEGIDISLISLPQPGDLVLVHAGSAVTWLEG